MAWYHKPLFGKHGEKVIVGICLYEVVALVTEPVPWIDLPPITELNENFWPVGIAVLGALAHHFYIEDPDKV